MICSGVLRPGSRAKAKRHIQERKTLIKNFNFLSAALKFERLIENQLLVFGKHYLDIGLNTCVNDENL